jgi:hypothetical protein
MFLRFSKARISFAAFFVCDNCDYIRQRIIRARSPPFIQLDICLRGSLIGKNSGAESYQLGIILSEGIISRFSTVKSVNSLIPWSNRLPSRYRGRKARRSPFTQATEWVANFFAMFGYTLHHSPQQDEGVRSTHRIRGGETIFRDFASNLWLQRNAHMLSRRSILVEIYHKLWLDEDCNMFSYQL